MKPRLTPIALSALHRPATFQSPRAQRGVVLFIALIVLVAMTLAGIALVRSVDTANVVAGNVAFKQAALHETDVGVGTAMTLLRTGALAGSASYNDDLTRNYYATLALPNDSRGIPTALLGDTTTFDTTYGGGTGNVITGTAQTQIRFLIERLCSATGAYNTTNCALDAASSPIPESGGSTNPELTGAEAVALYRVSVRVDGPRNTVSYTQTIIRV